VAAFGGLNKFQMIFFSILAIYMATAAILKKSTLDSTTSHGI
jgi:hypothetical protein